MDQRAPNRKTRRSADFIVDQLKRGNQQRFGQVEAFKESEVVRDSGRCRRRIPDGHHPPPLANRGSLAYIGLAHGELTRWNGRDIFLGAASFALLGDHHHSFCPSIFRSTLGNAMANRPHGFFRLHDGRGGGGARALLTLALLALGALCSGVGFAQSLALSPATLPGGSVGSPYVHTLSASGGTPPYSTPSVTSGTAPPGTTFAPGSASFSFTPASATTFNFTLSMGDSVGGTAVQAYSIVVRQPSTAAATAGTPQSAQVGTAFATQLQVHVADAGNAPVEGPQVSFTSPGSGPSGSVSASNEVITDASGNAVAPVFIANTIAGSYLVTASVPGLASPTSFSLTNTPGATASIVSIAGTPQSSAVTAAFATALQALVRDAFSNPISGVSVTFTAPGSGASGTFGGSATVTTNASGVATAPALPATRVP